jgi:L-fuculokinase
MPSGDIAVVFDCGATNVRVIAIDSKGNIVASASEANSTSADPFFPSYRIWDINKIWQKLCAASRAVTSKIDRTRIAGVTVTTFGVDGTIFSRNGEMLYPVISWQCERTVPVLESIDRYITVSRLYEISGVLPFSFNTITKLIWLKENRPQLFEKAYVFLYTPSILSYFLSGEMVNDITMAGTSMTTSLASRGYSEEIFNSIGISPGLMGRTIEPGTVSGHVTASASSETGLPVGTPVVAGGHDTQFALFGSGAGVNEPVLSSGTWEILMARSEGCLSTPDQMKAGITTEFDARPGLFDIGNQWIASGALEWIRKTFYPSEGDDVYEMMIAGAEKVPSGSRGVKVIPSFAERSGAGITGLTMDSTREDIYRATLEALAERLKHGKEALEKAGGFNASTIICVGGGSRNRLWNQLRANATGARIKVCDRKETTVLGASLFVQYATGNASSPEDAAGAVEYHYTEFVPGKE